MTIKKDDLKWNDHVDAITFKAARRLYLLSQLKRAGISPDDLLAFYYSFIRSVLEFSCQLFHRILPKYLSDDIKRIHSEARYSNNLSLFRRLIRQKFQLFQRDVKHYLLNCLTTL